MASAVKHMKNGLVAFVCGVALDAATLPQSGVATDSPVLGLTYPLQTRFAVLKPIDVNDRRKGRTLAQSPFIWELGRRPRMDTG